ncbi:MAG: NAD(P)H-dependent oxidoreductase subunit E [Acidimicrobiales bacterium]|nr:NAD(P)H-dependent oxidoreductase subunit E [Acidimicrobiales bacterium]
MARLSPERVAQARETISLYPEPRSALVPLCHLAQEQDGWLTPEAMEHVAELLGLTPAEVLGTASFYDLLHTEPVGRYLIGVCTNIACLLSGGLELLEHAEARLGVKAGGTTPDGLFTLEEVECVAYCDRAPCAMVNWRHFGPLGPEDFDRLVEDVGAGRHDDEVPPHGVLSRVRREGGLRVTAEEVASERAEADRARAERAEVERQAAARQAEADKRSGGGAG